MENTIMEASFPINFRKEDAFALGNYIKSRRSVVLIGMSRVGINSFLRFFLYHPDIQKSYIKDENTHLFIPVDLNNLVEREIFAFWILVLKRIFDIVEQSSLDSEIKKFVEMQFLDGIQLKDLFLLIEAVRKSLVKIVEANFTPTLFLIRFDRMKDPVTPEFFDNLEGLQDATHHKLSYVITSYRSLDKTSPKVFTKQALSAFSQDLYIKPLKKEDLEIILKSYKNLHQLKLTEKTEEKLLELVDGYNQYLQLALVYLQEHPNLTPQEMTEGLSKDERINLQSEELWESLETDEQKTLMKVINKDSLKDEEKSKSKYLFDTGLSFEDKKGYRIFSPLFENYLHQRNSSSKQLSDNNQVEFSKKENLLFKYLQNNLDLVCEREAIIESVWPEVDSLGVSDWAIDRLVARLRNKLKQQKSEFGIVTVKTRGYKLVNLK